MFACYYREKRGSLLLIIGESIMANLDYVCLNNQSHYSLTELYDTQSALTDTIGINGKCHKLNPACRKKSVTSPLIKQ